MPRRERRRQRASLRALSEAHDLALLFPRLRAHDAVLDAYADRIAGALGAEELRQEWIEDGVALLDAQARRGIVASLRNRYPERWRSLASAVGDEALTERSAVASVVLATILERQPLGRGVLELLEVMPPPASPCPVLVLVIDPHLVWERDDAIVVGRMVRHGGDGQRFYKEAHDLACARVEDWHVERVRSLAEHVRSQLPAAGLERATALLEAAVEEVDADEEAARWVAGALLAQYAELVALGKIENER
jgi:hypothetical protein